MFKQFIAWPLAALLLLASTVTSAFAGPAGSIVVANRGAGSISIIDAATMAVTTQALPGGTNTPEPMYVVADPVTDRFFVGDRANDRVVAYSASTFNPIGSIGAGSGVFHMWGNSNTGQLWAVNDTAQQMTALNMQTLIPIITFDTPANLSAFKPHDVVLDPLSNAAFVSMVDVVADNLDDWVIRYDTTTFTETHRVQAGDDPHISLSAKNDNKLFVAAQGANAVQVFNRSDLSPVAPSIAVNAAHGAAMTADGNTFYATNIAGGGTDGLAAIDTATQLLLGSTNTPFAVPHNVAVSDDQTKLFVTHSGATSDKVTVYDITGPNGIPVLIGPVDAGTNPFGLAAVAAVPGPAPLVLLLSGIVGLFAMKRRRG